MDQSTLLTTGLGGSLMSHIYLFPQDRDCFRHDGLHLNFRGDNFDQWWSSLYYELIESGTFSMTTPDILETSSHSIFHSQQ